MTRQKKTIICPLGGVGVGGKWKFWIWYHLLSGTKRFGELQRLIPEASRQMLTIQLRELEQIGVLQRRVYVQKSPKVEYSLTELGLSLGPLLRQMYLWGRWYGEQAGVEYDWFVVSLGGRWKFWIWYHLFSGPRRFSELQRLLPQATRQLLATQLRELEQMGVLHRQASGQGFTKVEYSLTELGRSSEPMLRQMYAWGRWTCDQIGLEYNWPVSDEIADERTQQIKNGMPWNTAGKKCSSHLSNAGAFIPESSP
ncbi:MAG TPA: winged helix-turn-helix transcriptional regulator [Ktedonobacteraceae bacterium]|nr:winged helix-turn-helix transcriptional regulator [Ktedonobacteraceae bacterium]